MRTPDFADFDPGFCNEDEATEIYEGETKTLLGKIQLKTDVGEMKSTDSPSVPLFNDPFTISGDTTFSIDLNFAEFARLELLSADREDDFFDNGELAGRVWYRISDLEDWFFHIRLKFDATTGKWKDNGSTFGK